MATILVLVALVAFLLWLEVRRISRRFEAGKRRLEEAWEGAERAFRERLKCLEDFSRILAAKGLVPKGREELERVLAEARTEGLSPASISELEEKLRALLWRIYSALPRERPPELRACQDELARATEEFDLARRRYNDLAASWNGLFQRTFHRIVAKRRGYEPVDLLPVYSEWELP